MERVETGESLADNKETDYSDLPLTFITAYIADVSRKSP
jgi:hypothetical protein